LIRQSRWRERAGSEGGDAMYIGGGLLAVILIILLLIWLL
jgi:flagellar biogenesis protein FliO